MRDRILSWFALLLMPIGIALYVAFVVLMLPIRNSPLVSFGGRTPLDELPGQTVNILTMLAGAFLAVKRPRHPIGWLLCATGIGLTMYPFALVLVARLYSLEREAPPALLWFAWSANWMWVLAFVGLIYTLLLFPTGQLLSRRWRPVSWAAAASLAGALWVSAFASGPLQAAEQWSNPLASEFAGNLVMPFVVIVVVFEVLAICALILRFWRSRGLERQQMKWLAFGAGVHGVVTGISMVLDVPRWVQAVGPAIMVAAVVIAVMRYRLYDIDLIVRRTLIYGMLCVTLALIYVGGIITLQPLVRPLVGADSQFATVASTLAIAALFNPLRHRIQNLIDRRFYRRKYDSAKTLHAFSTRLRHEVELRALTNDLITAVDETLQPSHVSLWLKPIHREWQR